MELLVSLILGLVAAILGFIGLVLARRRKKLLLAAIPLLVFAAAFLLYTALGVFLVLSID